MSSPIGKTLAKPLGSGLASTSNMVKFETGTEALGELLEEKAKALVASGNMTQVEYDYIDFYERYDSLYKFYDSGNKFIVVNGIWTGGGPTACFLGTLNTPYNPMDINTLDDFIDLYAPYETWFLANMPTGTALRGSFSGSATGLLPHGTDQNKFYVLASVPSEYNIPAPYNLGFSNFSPESQEVIEFTLSGSPGSRTVTVTASENIVGKQSEVNDYTTGGLEYGDNGNEVGMASQSFLYVYQLSTQWDVMSANWTTQSDIFLGSNPNCFNYNIFRPSQDSRLRDGSNQPLRAADIHEPISQWWKSDGTKCILITGSSFSPGSQYILNLSTAWDLSTATINSFDYETSLTLPNSVYYFDYSDDGTKCIWRANNTFYSRSVGTGTPYKIWTFNGPQVNIALPTDHGSISSYKPYGLTSKILGNGNHRVWITDGNDQAVITEYTLTTPYDANTITSTVTKRAKVGGYSYDYGWPYVTGQDTLFGIQWNLTGTVMYTHQYAHPLKYLPPAGQEFSIASLELDYDQPGFNLVGSMGYCNAIDDMSELYSQSGPLFWWAGNEARVIKFGQAGTYSLRGVDVQGFSFPHAVTLESSGNLTPKIFDPSNNTTSRVRQIGFDHYWIHMNKKTDGSRIAIMGGSNSNGAQYTGVPELEYNYTPYMEWELTNGKLSSIPLWNYVKPTSIGDTMGKPSACTFYGNAAPIIINAQAFPDGEWHQRTSTTSGDIYYPWYWNSSILPLANGFEYREPGIKILEYDFLPLMQTYWAPSANLWEVQATDLKVNLEDTKALLAVRVRAKDSTGTHAPNQIWGNNYFIFWLEVDLINGTVIDHLLISQALYNFTGNTGSTQFAGDGFFISQDYKQITFFANWSTDIITSTFTTAFDLSTVSFAITNTQGTLKPTNSSGSLTFNKYSSNYLNYKYPDGSLVYGARWSLQGLTTPYTGDLTINPSYSLPGVEVQTAGSATISVPGANILSVDGTRVLRVRAPNTSTGNLAVQTTFTTGFNFTSSFTESTAINISGGAIKLNWSLDGTKLYQLTHNNGTVGTTQFTYTQNIYTASTAYDATTLSLSSSSTVVTAYWADYVMSDNGTKVLVTQAGNSAYEIIAYVYSLSTPFDMATKTLDTSRTYFVSSSRFPVMPHTNPGATYKRYPEYLHSTNNTYEDPSRVSASIASLIEDATGFVHCYLSVSFFVPDTGVVSSISMSAQYAGTTYKIASFDNFGVFSVGKENRHGVIVATGPDGRIRTRVSPDNGEPAGYTHTPFWHKSLHPAYTGYDLWYDGNPAVTDYPLFITLGQLNGGDTPSPHMITPMGMLNKDNVLKADNTVEYLTKPSSIDGDNLYLIRVNLTDSTRQATSLSRYVGQKPYKWGSPVAARNLSGSKIYLSSRDYYDNSPLFLWYIPAY